MRNRPGPEQDNERERERDKTNQRMERQERRTQTRIPKIQYRFLKELEEQGVSKETRDDAYAMAGKIRRFPLEEKHVMGSWERFTRTAIEAYKQGHGSDAERTRQHRAYAVLFSAIRGHAPIQNSLDLKIRVDKFEVEPRPPSTRDEKPHAATPVVQQRTLPLPGRDTVERPEMEKRIDKALTKLRDLPSEPDDDLATVLQNQNPGPAAAPDMNVIVGGPELEQLVHLVVNAILYATSAAESWSLLPSPARAIKNGAARFGKKRRQRAATRAGAMRRAHSNESVFFLPGKIPISQPAPRAGQRATGRQRSALLALHGAGTLAPAGGNVERPTSPVDRALLEGSRDGHDRGAPLPHARLAFWNNGCLRADA